MIWLIGKAYSADPTRSAAKRTYENKGLGSSFESIAKGIRNSGQYSDFHKELSKLRKITYSYVYENDRSILKDTAKLVATFNGMIVTTMQEAAQEKNLDHSKVKNVISFSSKFLHFMCPHLFFIIDSYSFNGAVALFSGKSNRKLYISDEDAAKNMDIDQATQNYFKKHLLVDTLWKEDLANAQNDAYYAHCLRCYCLACFLKQNGKQCKEQISGDPTSVYMPRLADSILMRITK